MFLGSAFKRFANSLDRSIWANGTNQIYVSLSLSSKKPLKTAIFKGCFFSRETLVVRKSTENGSG